MILFMQSTLCEKIEIIHESCGLYIFESDFLWSDFQNIDIYEEKCCYDDCQSKLMKAVVTDELFDELFDKLFDDFYCSYEPVIGDLYWACEGNDFNYRL